MPGPVSNNNSAINHALVHDFNKNGNINAPSGMQGMMNQAGEKVDQVAKPIWTTMENGGWKSAAIGILILGLAAFLMAYVGYTWGGHGMNMIGADPSPSSFSTIAMFGGLAGIGLYALYRSTFKPQKQSLEMQKIAKGILSLAFAGVGLWAIQQTRIAEGSWTGAAGNGWFLIGAGMVLFGTVMAAAYAHNIYHTRQIELFERCSKRESEMATIRSDEGRERLDHLNSRP